jgi:glycosyltransferase involved in cell wall biosynthesis
MREAAMSRYRLSVVVVAFNMERELPRTIRSLSPVVQRDLAADDYEIIVVDNGSAEPVDVDRCRQWGGNVRVYHRTNAAVSPAVAINAGLALAEGELIGVMIDGARMASPGLLSASLRAARLHARPAIASLGFHLGPDVQYRSVHKGYDQRAEDALLAGIDWPTDGYRLFDISVFAGSSGQGWFRPIGESNALFLSRLMWQELGGYDERFVSPGGGMINLDTYVRACELPDSQLVILLGEGTFHQVHGGVATNARTSLWDDFHAEYVSVKGKPFAPPAARPWYFGEVDPCVLKSIELSVRLAKRRHGLAQFIAPMVTRLHDPTRSLIWRRLWRTRNRTPA